MNATVGLAVGTGIGRFVKSDCLPDKNGNYAQCRQEQSDAE
jgi:hypothetical protein